MKITIFGKKGCAKCETTKNKLSHFLKKWNYDNAVSISFIDMDTVNGMAEGSYMDVINIPATIITQQDNSIVARWDGEVPDSEEVKKSFEVLLAKV